MAKSLDADIADVGRERFPEVGLDSAANSEAFDAPRTRGVSSMSSKTSLSVHSDVGLPSSHSLYYDI